jgi:hypothetical protein
MDLRFLSGPVEPWRFFPMPGITVASLENVPVRADSPENRGKTPVYVRAGIKLPPVSRRMLAYHPLAFKR